MWEMVFGQKPAGEDDRMQRVQVVADEIDGQCPARVDSATTLVSCRLDTAARTMIYRYEVPEPMVRLLQKDEAARRSLRQSVEQAFLSQEGRRLAGYLRDAGVSVEYLYFNPRVEKPVSFVFAPDQLAGGGN